MQDNYSSDKGNTFPTMADFLQWHGDEIYHLLVKEFLRKVVGGKTWKNNCYRLLLPEYCSMSSEAFCLLTLENNCDRWISMANSGDQGNEVTMMVVVIERIIKVRRNDNRIKK